MKFHYDDFMAETKKRISIVEDNDVIRDGFELLLNSLSEYKVASAYDNAEDAIKNVLKDNPDIILMDVELPGINGIEATRRIKKILPDVNIIVITVHEESDLVFEALCAGAVGYMTKNTDHSKFLAGIDEVLKGGAPMSSKIARLVVNSFQRNNSGPLSDRETEVLELLSKGKSYTVIADELFIHKETVKSHIKNIYFKLQVHSKADAIEVALKNRYI